MGLKFTEVILKKSDNITLLFLNTNARDVLHLSCCGARLNTVIKIRIIIYMIMDITVVLSLFF